MKNPVSIKGDEKGFSLIELIVVILILGILAGFAIPAFSTWLPNYRLRSAAQDLLAGMQLAKLTAIKRNSTCVITFDTNSLIVSIDSNSDDIYDIGVEEIVFQKQWSEYEGVYFDTSQGGGDGIDYSNSPPSVAFRSNGLPTQNGTVYFINTKGKTASVAMSAAGNIEITT